MRNHQERATGRVAGEPRNKRPPRPGPNERVHQEVVSVESGTRPAPSHRAHSRNPTQTQRGRGVSRGAAPCPRIGKSERSERRCEGQLAPCSQRSRARERSERTQSFAFRTARRTEAGRARSLLLVRASAASARRERAQPRTRRDRHIAAPNRAPDHKGQARHFDAAERVSRPHARSANVPRPIRDDRALQ